MTAFSKVALGGLVALVLIGLSGSVWAQGKGRGRVIQIEALRVEGRIQKPEAFYILQRSELNFKGLEPKKSFIPLILKSVEKAPF
jgi:hypothetical protein